MPSLKELDFLEFLRRCMLLFHIRIYELYNKSDLTKQLLASNWSKCITLIFTYTFIAIITHQILMLMGRHLGLISRHTDVFIETPTHCSHVYVSVNVIQNRPKRELLSRPIVYYIEFGPDDYEDPDLGTTLGFLRRKLLALLRENELLTKHNQKLNYIQCDKLEIFKKERLLTDDGEFLCNMDVNTGDKLTCIALI
ncbi:hypothetical protein KL942_004091 [Ogataea angusta]|uniref:Uncharacterized protein n=1 Tax=Pichia angusta TaxID=870730 RepID=A0AAN6DDC1_PICAN|nr:uncharacterized protein KL928_004471 [Ogataea angusta]KAG7816429.1 hypothetical protein KL928_004471 [Ogataea angusta]KAG7828016.1 hypothetical protein KL920_003743 [Ogataea angusta]KAG7833119.1 hypothetical protein KL943_004567 [Ogataea angusta]KAG7837679.1 hypothetical protein KL942_004091 [Ogataea angusta]KAG7843782.1 hypothetical protein KL941_004264 [Ogataea angusta]